MGKPCLPNIEPLINLGINPTTGLPIKFGGTPLTLKEDMLKFFRVMDEQTAVRRYQWFNLPDGLDGELLERILYYKGQACFFYDEITDKFYFLPFTLDGVLDVYGRYKGIKPLPFGTNDAKEGKVSNAITMMHREPQYEIVLPEEWEEDMLKKKCVLIHDYCKQISQTILPRQALQDPVLNVMSELVPFMRTKLIASTGIKGMRVNNADEYPNVTEAGRSFERSALTGQMYVPIVGAMDFQDLTNANGGQAVEDFMMALQAIDNLRLSSYGIESGGVFEKKAHTLESEQAMNQASVGPIYQDGLLIRQRFCNIVNSIFGIGIWCDASESVLGVDADGDGVEYDQDADSGDANVNDGGSNNENNSEI